MLYHYDTNQLTINIITLKPNLRVVILSLVRIPWIGHSVSLFCGIRHYWPVSSLVHTMSMILCLCIILLENMREIKCNFAECKNFLKVFKKKKERKVLLFYFGYYHLTTIAKKSFLNFCNFGIILTIAQTRETLLKGKVQYSWPPYTTYFRSAAFDVANITYFFTKQASLMRRSTLLSLPLQLVFPTQTSKTFNMELRIRSGKLEWSFCGNFFRPIIWPGEVSTSEWVT
jgi:hypothetical protein